MSLQFLNALEVASGDDITSRERNALADALNSRALSGAGDYGWRLAYWAMGLVRSMRNPAADMSTWPPLDEWLSVWAHVKPEDGGWPLASPGDPEGANLANPLAAYVHGAAWAGLDDEATLLAGLPGFPPLPGSTESEVEAAAFWDDGKDQRGAVDFEGGYHFAPYIDIPYAMDRIAHPDYTGYQRSFGGWRGVPPESGTCGDSSPRRTYIFTPLRPELTEKEFDCCCPAESGGGIAAIHETRYTWIILGWMVDEFGEVVLDGFDRPQVVVVDLLTKSDYAEAGYTEAALPLHNDGRQLDVVRQAQATAFRGTDANRFGAAWEIHDVGFDYQRFFSSQYRLAPAKGHWSGTAMVADYPAWSISTPGLVDAGSMGDAHVIDSRFVAAGARLRVRESSGPVTVRITQGAVEIGTIQCSSGEDRAIWWDAPPLGGGSLVVEVVTEGIVLGSGGLIEVEVAELTATRPLPMDAWLLTRIGGVQDIADDLQSVGSEFSMPKRISDAYFTRGCASGRPVPPPEDEKINNSAFHEVARQSINRMLRLISRSRLRSYHVDGAGRSVLTYARDIPIPGGSGEVDAWAGIAPPRDPVSAIKDSVRYRVSGGSILYRGGVVASGAEFTGVFGDTTWEVDSGSPVVHQLDGILLAAPKDGEDNRWAMFFSHTVYATPEESLWKEAIHDRDAALDNRCHLYAGWLSRDRELGRFMAPTAYGRVQSPVLHSESPPGLTYSGGVGPDGDSLEFYRGCRIYPPPYEVRSVTTAQVGGEWRVTVTLQGRLHHNDDDWFPTDPDTAGWTNASILDMAGHPRTDENAIIQYLMRDRVACPICAGDFWMNGGADLDAIELPDDPRGACLPRTWLFRLMPKVHEDANTTQEDSDTVTEARHMEMAAVMLRSMAEGFVDVDASASMACSGLGGAVIDFNWTRFWYRATNGDRSTWPLVPDGIRPDRPECQGFYPNMDMHHQTWNWLVRAVNLLDRVRIDLPIRWRYRTKVYEGSVPLGGECFNSGNACRWVDDAPIPEVDLISVGDWSEWASDTLPSFGATSEVYLEACPWRVFRRDVRGEIQFDLSTSNAREAVPPGLRELIDGLSASVLGLMVDSVANAPERTAGSFEDTPECGPEEGGGSASKFCTDEGVYQTWDAAEPVVTSHCQWQGQGGASTPGFIGIPDLYACRSNELPDGILNGNGMSTSRTFNAVSLRTLVVTVPTITPTP